MAFSNWYSSFAFPILDYPHRHDLFDVLVPRPANCNGSFFVMTRIEENHLCDQSYHQWLSVSISYYFLSRFFYKINVRRFENFGMTSIYKSYKSEATAIVQLQSSCYFHECIHITKITFHYYKSIANYKSSKTIQSTWSSFLTIHPVIWTGYKQINYNNVNCHLNNHISFIL